MTRTIFVAIACFSFVGCGSDGGGNAPPGPVIESNPRPDPSPDRPTWNPDGPGGSDSRPATNPDRPQGDTSAPPDRGGATPTDPGNPDNPGAGGQPGNPGGGGCSTFCANVDPACSSDCTKGCGLFAGAPQCAQLLTAVGGCIQSSGGFICTDGQLDVPDGCKQALTSLNQCASGSATDMNAGGN